MQVGASTLNPNSSGLRSHLDEISVLVKSKGLDVSALNETKLDHSIKKQLTEITGYKQLRLVGSRCGGGISIYFRDTLKFLITNDIPGESMELVCIEVQPLKCKTFLFVARYRPTNDPVCTVRKFEKVLSYLDE